MANRASTVERDGDALFVKDGAPVRFCFHRSVTQGRDRITRDVERQGGRIVANEKHAHVLLVDEQEDIAFMRRRYYNSMELYRLSLYVEPRGFVRHCIRAGAYHHVAPIKQGMPGRTRGNERVRVAFSEEDRDKLARYLATLFPTRDGRMGNSAYKALVQLGQTDDPTWAWARRHTFHSWREHYKMNPIAMDARIECYLEQLKDVGHHFGQDPRRHNHRNLVQEEEEESSEVEEVEQQQGLRRNNKRPEQVQVRPAVAERRARERDFAGFEDEEGDDAQQEDGVQERQRTKRQRVYARPQGNVRVAHAKRAHASDSDEDERRRSRVEARPREGTSDREDSEEIEGSDLFGDRTYGDGADFKFDDQPFEFPRPFSPVQSLVDELEAAPPSTQATLIASPHAVEHEMEKEPAPAPRPSPKRVNEIRAPMIVAPAPSQPREMLAVARKRVVQRAHVRGTSVEPGSSAHRETRIRGNTATVVAEIPYRIARARSRSVEPQAQSQPKPEPGREPRRTRPREDKAGSDKVKAREEVLVPIEEDVQIEDAKEVSDVEEVQPVVSDVLSTRDTFEDEMVVEELLGTSVGSGYAEDERSEQGEEDEEDEAEDEKSNVSWSLDDDEEGLPRIQEVASDSEPTDSDDAETHGSLMRGAARKGSVDIDVEGDADGVSDVASEHGQDREGALDVRGGSVAANQGQDQDGDDEEDDLEESDEDEDDADRIERMAMGSLYALPKPVPSGPRTAIARTIAMQTLTRTQSQTQAEAPSQSSPRRTRSGRVRVQPTGFPSPGTKARAVVDRFQDEGKQMPYEPPAGSRAAKAMKGRGKRG